ncbi:MAG: glycosyltransferase family 2 protein [Candidatus Bathyarchaeia archaeon]
MTRRRRTRHDARRSYASPKIEVFVLNYNGQNHLKRCLPSLFKMTWLNFRVYVIDNGSTDGSQDFVRRKYPKVELIETGANLGFSRALNLAVSKSNASFVCLLNNDMKVTPNWLNVLMKDFQDPNVAVAVPKMYDFLGRLNSAGGACDFYGFAYNRGIGEIDRGQYDQPCYVPYGCLGAAIIRKSVFDEIGYLDQTYVFYHEDVDFSWRLILRGHKIAYNPRSVVYHHHMGTMMAIGRSRIIGLWERNRFRTLLKNYQTKTLLTVLPTLAILKVLHMGYALTVNKDANEIRAVFSAYVWNLRQIKDTIRERRRIQVSRRAPDSELRRLLIPWSIELRLGLGMIYHPIARRGPGFMLSHPFQRP